MVAYFSMKIGIEPDMPTYASGLGVLAGDFVRAAADLGVPLMAVTAAPPKGVFSPASEPSRTPARGASRVGRRGPSRSAAATRDHQRPADNRPRLAALRHEVGGATVPVYFLDTDVRRTRQTIARPYIPCAGAMPRTG
jgi:glycogen phosphorylase